MRTLAQPTSRSGFDVDYLRRSAARLDHLAASDARSATVRSVAARIHDPGRRWDETVRRAWAWLPTHYVEERTGDRWQRSRETLTRGVGDCEDWSVVLAAVLKANRVDCRVVAMPQHIAVAVRVPARDLVYSEAMVTVRGWEIYLHHAQPWLFLESTLGPKDRAGRMPGWGAAHIAAFADSPYLQIASARPAEVPAPASRSLGVDPPES
ncbi:MAG: hypothetical protein IAG13_03760 [Deltaproteobacteria bacterium]|nr:hypothetical protein [Nannocystaceae bacterium]